MSQTEDRCKSIENMNLQLSKQQDETNLVQASLKVRHESMLVNEEFSQIEQEPELTMVER